MTLVSLVALVTDITVPCNGDWQHFAPGSTGDLGVPGSTVNLVALVTLSALVTLVAL